MRRAYITMVTTLTIIVAFLLLPILIPWFAIIEGLNGHFTRLNMLFVKRKTNGEKIDEPFQWKGFAWMPIFTLDGKLALFERVCVVGYYHKKGKRKRFVPYNMIHLP